VDLPSLRGAADMSVLRKPLSRLQAGLRSRGWNGHLPDEAIVTVRVIAAGLGTRSIATAGTVDCLGLLRRDPAITDTTGRSPAECGGDLMVDLGGTTFISAAGLTPARCVVCGNAVAAGEGLAARWQGRALRFRCLGCLARFEADPDRYLLDHATDSCRTDDAECSPMSEWTV
jgi:hypothetical protein